jgi:hypothetical protein
MKIGKQNWLLALAIAVCAPAMLSAQTINTFAGKAGTGSYKGDGGLATAGALNKPASVAVDKQGNVFIADFYNNVVRKVSPAGIITTIAGNNTEGYCGDGGPATAAKLHGPWGVAADEAGNVYFTDKENHAVRKVNTSGIITTIAGKGKPGYWGDNGPATAALLNHPLGLAVDNAGNIYVADNSNTAVRKINAAGTISTFAGNHKAGYSGDGGPATAASFKNIRYVACDANGNIFISDTWNSVIRKVNPAGIVSTFAGNHTMKYSGDGGQATAAGIYFPVGITVAADGSLYIADNHNHVIRRVGSDGLISTVVGNGTRGYSGDGGPATASQMANPTSIAIDATGKLYIAEFVHNLIRVVNMPGEVKPIADGNPTGINVYPNPSHGAFTVSLPEYKTPAAIAIIDVAGKVVENRVLSQPNAQAVPFMLNNAAAGSYIVKVVSGGITESVKIVVE